MKAFTQSLKEQELSDVLKSQKIELGSDKRNTNYSSRRKIVFTRTVCQIPEIFTDEEWNSLKEEHYIHELGRVCNISSNYEYTIEVGLETRK